MSEYYYLDYPEFFEGDYWEENENYDEEEYDEDDESVSDY